MCTLCSKDVCTTAHILGACKVSLVQGRYTFRHDTVLHQVIAALKSLISNKKKQYLFLLRNIVPISLFQKFLNPFKVVYHPVSCLLYLHIYCDF